LSFWEFCPAYARACCPVTAGARKRGIIVVLVDVVKLILAREARQWLVDAIDECRGLSGSFNEEVEAPAPPNYSWTGRIEQGLGVVVPVPCCPSLHSTVPFNPSAKFRAFPVQLRPVDSRDNQVLYSTRDVPREHIFLVRILLEHDKFLTMKADELTALAPVLDKDFKTIEPHLLALDKHLTLRTYLDGYALGENDKAIWVALRSNRAATSFILRGALANLLRWFAYVEATHPEIQDAIKAAEAEKKKKVAAASKAGGNYALALQDADKGVVTRFLPEPS